MKKVVIGILGSVMDKGAGPGRWDLWRPTVSLFQQEDLLIDRLDLIREPRSQSLAKQVSADICQVSPETEVIQHDGIFQDPWDFEEVFGTLHAFAKSYPFDTDKEEYYIHITTGSHVQQICLFLLTESGHLPARLIQTSPPRRRNSGAPGRYHIIDLDLSRYDRIADRFQEEKDEALDFLKSGIATRNQSYNRLIESMETVSVRSTAPMLLMGPTGAGKSHLARRIYELKKARRQLTGPFVEVNCATLRGESTMSNLFGHIRGAFTGAQNARKGCLLSAHEGMLFLDEIGELGLDEQAMLLRAIEEKRFFPLGSDSEVKSDFQLIGGTNRDLSDAVRTGQFREDLFARINLWTFHLPGLRDRREDLEPNLDFELTRYANKTGQRITMNKEARDRFLEFALSPEAVWKGNFRDLNAAVSRMATLAGGKRITCQDVQEETARLKTLWSHHTTQAAPTPDQTHLCVLPEPLSKNLDLFDQAQLAAVLKTCHEAPTMAEAGRRLFSVSRQQLKSPNDSDRLRKYLLKFGLTWRDVRKTKQVNPPPKEQAPSSPHFEPHTFQPAIRP